MPSQRTSREAIIAKVLPVLRRNGFFHTSMADLASACELQKAHLYYYFENKEALMAGVLESVHWYFRERVFSLAYASEPSPALRLQHLLGQIAKVLGRGEGGCLMGNTALEAAPLALPPEFLHIVRAFFTDLLDALTELYESEHPPAKARKMAEQATQDLEGGLMLMQVFQDEGYFFRALQRAGQGLSSA